MKRGAYHNGQSQAGAGNNMGFIAAELSPTAENVRSKEQLKWEGSQYLLIFFSAIYLQHALRDIPSLNVPQDS